MKRATFCGLFALLVALSSAKTQVLFIGGGWSMLIGPQLQNMLGPDYKLSFRDGLVNDTTMLHPDVVVLDLDPSATFGVKSLSQFFKEGRASVISARTQFKPRTMYLLLPQPIYIYPQLKTDYAPLIKQIAREEHVDTIDLDDPLYPVGDDNSGSIRKLYVSLIHAQRNPGAWVLVSATSEQTDEGPAKNAIDNNPDTYWHTRYDPNPTKVPHEIVIDFGKEQTITGFSYLARQDGGVNGRVRDFELYLSDDPNKWAQPALKGTLQNSMNEQRLLFDHPATGRYLRFVALSEVNGNIWTSIAELGILPFGTSK